MIPIIKRIMNRLLEHLRKTQKEKDKEKENNVKEKERRMKREKERKERQQKRDKQNRENIVKLLKKRLDAQKIKSEKERRKQVGRRQNFIVNMAHRKNDAMRKARERLMNNKVNEDKVFDNVTKGHIVENILAFAKRYDVDPIRFNPTDIKVSDTRSSAITIPVRYKGRDLFLKITPEFSKDPVTMAQAEIEMYKVTGFAQKMKMTTHFVREFSSELLWTSTVTLNYKVLFGTQTTNRFTILIIDRLKHITLEKFMEMTDSPMKDRTTQLVLMIQLMHTLYLLNMLGIKHLDLHFGNILVVESAKTRLFDEYIISNGPERNSGYTRFWLPQVGYSIRLIDYDSAVKFNRSGIIDNRYKQLFKRPIPNPMMMKGNLYKKPVDTHQTNFYKVLKNPIWNKRNSAVSGRFAFFMTEYRKLLSPNETLFMMPDDMMFRKFVPRYAPSRKDGYELFRDYQYLVNDKFHNLVLPNKVIGSPLNLLLKMPDFKTPKSPGLVGATFTSVFYPDERKIEKFSFIPMNIDSPVNRK